MPTRLSAVVNVRGGDERAARKSWEKLPAVGGRGRRSLLLLGVHQTFVEIISPFKHYTLTTTKAICPNENTTRHKNGGAGPELQAGQVAHAELQSLPSCTASPLGQVDRSSHDLSRGKLEQRDTDGLYISKTGTKNILFCRRLLWRPCERWLKGSKMSAEGPVAMHVLSDRAQIKPWQWAKTGEASSRC